MAVVNDERGAFQNGSLGTVASMADESVEVRFDNGMEVTVGKHRWPISKAEVARVDDPVTGKVKKTIKNVEVGSFTQIPLRLAYAVTIHKSQGQTFDKVVAETHTFASGQLYVALSRCLTSAGLQIYP